jgi:uncharacterized membrane protein YhaH (DUF805 family)
MDGPKRLIDFRGHAKRGEYWAISVGASVISLIFGAIGNAAPQSLILSLLTLVVVFFVVLPIHAAAAVRRLHDRGKSGWWALLFLGTGFIGGLFAPALGLAGNLSSVGIVAILAFVAIIVWAFVELGVLPGKTKGNRYLGAADSKLAAAFD